MRRGHTYRINKLMGPFARLGRRGLFVAYPGTPKDFILRGVVAATRGVDIHSSLLVNERLIDVFKRFGSQAGRRAGQGGPLVVKNSGGERGETGPLFYKRKAAD